MNDEYIERYLIEMKDVIDRLDKESVTRIMNMILEARERGSTVFIIGNGGSASTATHFASDLAKTAMVEGKKRIKAMSLVDNIPLVSAWTNDTGFDNIYKGQLENFLKPNDLVIAISVHGGRKDWSNNLIKAVEYAKQNSAKTIALTGFDGGEMKNIVDECLIVPVNSTSHVESLHVALHHLITFGIKEEIMNEK